MAVEELEAEEDFPDPTRPPLMRLSSAPHPFAIPWRRESRPLLSSFDSHRAKNVAGPWVNTPFDTGAMRMHVVLTDAYSNKTSYREGLSTRSLSNHDHLSVSLGVTVGYPFLNANVTAEYDRTVTTNENSTQASRNSTCRVGRVVLKRPPVLSLAAITLLQTKGEEVFRQRYGDYYVCGYELGADAGACLSAFSSSKLQKERLKITVTVKVLWAKASVSTEKTFSSFDSAATFTFSGYSTLDEKALTVSAVAWSMDSLSGHQKAAALYMNKIATLEEEVRRVMSRLGLANGQDLPLSNASQICESGVVAQLLLAPYARLNQYIECRTKRPQSQQPQPS